MGEAVSKVAIARAITAIESCGHPVKGLRLHVDGSVSVLTEVPAGALPSANDDGDWVSLAGQKEVPRAGRP